MPNQPNLPIKIAVVGDVHDQWEPADAVALKNLGVDLVLFVGDFGNESLSIVRQVAELDLPKAVVLGNHDAWYTASEWGRKKSPYDHSKEDRVQKQLDLLGKSHVGYGKIDFPHLDISVLGSRPFSWGGSKWKNEHFYQERYGVGNFADSTAKIVEAAQKTSCKHLIILAHNGPFGLGDRPSDSCGRDWQPLGGDFGDPDLTAAMAEIRKSRRDISLVTFGHMHHRLRHTQSQTRQAINQDQQGTIYFNAAVVPRIRETSQGKQRNFNLISWFQGKILEISLVWVQSEGKIAQEHVFYQHQSELILYRK